LLVLARILSPADFGLGAMAGLFINISNTLAEFGLGTAVLHMPELDRRALGQLHVFSVAICAVACLLSVAAAPLAAGFFHSDNIIFFVAVNSILLITGFQAVPMGLLQRDMDYRRLAMSEAATVLVQSIVQLVCALLGFGPWTLMAGTFAGKGTAAILVCIWKPVPFHWPRLSEIRAPIRMGWHLAVGRLANAIYSQSDYIIVGRLMGDATLGAYQMAMNLASAPAEKVSALLMRTAAPLFANVMNDQPLVRRYYGIVLESLSLLILPLMLGLALVAPEGVAVILGPKWGNAVEPLRWLTLFVILRTMGVLTDQVLVSQRRTRLTMRASIVNFCLMPAAFYSAARWLGPGAVAAAWVMLAPVTMVPMLVILLRAIHLPFRTFLNTVAPALSGSAIMCLAVYGAKLGCRLAHLGPRSTLPVEVAVGAIVYAGFQLLFFSSRFARYVDFIRGFVTKKPAANPLAA
jgi:PST family polysaccharide transporter